MLQGVVVLAVAAAAAWVRDARCRVIATIFTARVPRPGDPHRGAATCSRRSAARSPSASGMIDLALEAKLLFGAFAAAAVGHATGSALAGIAAGIAAGMLVAAVQVGLRASGSAPIR